MKRIMAIITAGVLGIGAMGLSGCAADKAQANSGKTSTSKAAYGDLVLGLSSDGKIKLPVTNLNFEVGGTIKDVYVAAGDTVNKGDVLAELDDSELQLALATAEKNLEKAEAAYDDTIANQDYNVQTELASYQANLKKQTTAFDDYTYQQQIKNAQTTLERREKELEDAKASLKEAELKAPSTSVTLNISRKEEDLAEAQKGVDEAEAALAKAEKDLKDAKAAAYDTFDDYTYKLNIESAKLSVTRKETDYKDALSSYNDAVLARSQVSATAGYSQADYEAANSKVTSADKSLAAAKNALDDAKTQLTKSETDLQRAKESFATQQGDSKDKSIEAAEKTVESAQKAVDSAKKSVESAKRQVEDAKLSLTNSEQDLINAVTSAKKQVDTASTNVTDAKTSLQSAYDSLERAKIQYDKDMDSLKTTIESQLMKLSNLQGSSSSITNALYSIEDAKLKLEEAENNLAKLKITSPIDGSVLAVSKKAGEQAQSNSNAPSMVFGTSTSSGVVTICDPTAIYLTASVTEGDITGVTVGQTIKVAVDALGEESLYAKVYSISSIPSTDSSGIVTYEVIGIMDEVNPNLRDNMSAFLTFIKKEIQNALLVPNKAIYIEEGLQYVNVQKEDGAIEKREVTGGFSNGTQTEIKDGLQEGETVVIGSAKS